MRVVFLTQWFDPEPGAMRGLPLARALRQTGSDVEIVTGFPNYPGGRVYPGYRIRPWQRETMHGVPVLRVPLWPSHNSNPLGRVANYSSFALSAAILGTALSRRPDVAYVYHPPPTLGIPAATFKRAHRVPFVYHIADMWPESVVESGMLGHGRIKDIANEVLGAYCKWVYKEAAAITVLSPGFKRLLVERGVRSDLVHIVYNWTDDDLFHPMPRDERLAIELGLHGKFNVVYAGNLGAFQALDVVIRAAALVRDEPDIQIVIVGTGTEEARLKALATSVGAPNVLFAGRRDVKEMPRINVLADVLLVHLKDLPFFRATIPSKTQVSFASARPILMAVCGDAADVVRDAGAGIAVPPEDPQAMARAIREFHSMEREHREAMGRAGRRYYLDRMSLAVGSERMSRLFSEVVARYKKAQPVLAPQ